MLEGMAVFLVALAVYAVILAVQTRWRKYAWAAVFKRGDPWFVINLPISLVVAIPLSRSITSFFM